MSGKKSATSDGSIWLRVLILVASIILGGYILASTGAFGDLFGFQFRGQEVPLWHAGVAFAMTFLGVLFSLIVQQSQNIVELSWSDLGRALLKYSTPGSLIVSAMVYAYAFQTLYGSIGDWVAYFSALQSGFFFNQTLAAVTAGLGSKDGGAGLEPGKT